MKTGLVLEGGAMRGMFTCGVLDVLMEHGIDFDGAAGVSAGAVFGCNFKSHQIGRPIRYNKKYCNDPRYCSLRSLITTGDLYGADFCYRELPGELDPFDRKAFSNNPLPFYITATDTQTGKAVYHLCSDGGEEDLKWMRASASMPIVSRPVQVDGQMLLDGGIADPVPYQFMSGLGYDRLLLILTQPKGYRKKKGLSLPLLRLFLPHAQGAAKAMACRYSIYNQQMEEIDRLEQEKSVFVIRPLQALGISRTEKDSEELERVYQLGRAEALRLLTSLQLFLYKGN